MSASEKLRALEHRVNREPELEAWELCRASFPQIVAVVEAAEVEPWAFVANDGDGREAVAVDLADWRKVQAALSELDKALSAPSGDVDWSKETVGQEGC